MNRFEKIAVVAAVLATWLYADATESVWDLYVVRPHLPWLLTAFALAGWILSNYVPIAVALLYWRRAKQARRPWVFHLLLLPSIILATWAGDSMMLQVTGEPDFDATIGAPVIIGMYLLIVAVLGYAAAVIAHRNAREAVKAG
ncbi:MAG: hypothetical protein ABW023_09640 [Sphingomonas sp.]